jgi:hypothetical protein
MGPVPSKAQENNSAPEKFSFLEFMDSGTMDWTHMKMRTLGRGRPRNLNGPLLPLFKESRLLAEEDAYNNLIQSVNKLTISEKYTIGNKLQDTPKLQTEVHKKLRQFRIENTVYYSNGAVDVDVELPLASLFAKILGAEKNDKTLSPVPKKGSRVFSGLIVDAQEIVFYPVLSPTLLGEDNLVLYNLEKVKGNFVHQHGVVGYHKTLSQAKKDSRIGKKPLIVKALRADSLDSLIMPSNLQSSDLNLRFLEEGRVIIVLPSEGQS